MRAEVLEYLAVRGVVVFQRQVVKCLQKDVGKLQVFAFHCEV